MYDNSFASLKDKHQDEEIGTNMSINANQMIGNK